MFKIVVQVQVQLVCGISEDIFNEDKQ